MIGNSSPSVKSNPPAFNPGDPACKLSLAYAVEHGYQFRLDGDGNAEVSKPDGTAYYVIDFVCNCPDRKVRGGSHGGRCKHELWASQIRPCEMCGGTMALGTFKTAFGEVLRRFECPDCGDARDFRLVKMERRERREAAQVA